MLETNPVTVLRRLDEERRRLDPLVDRSTLPKSHAERLVRAIHGRNEIGYVDEWSGYPILKDLCDLAQGQVRRTRFTGVGFSEELDQDLRPASAGLEEAAMLYYAEPALSTALEGDLVDNFERIVQTEFPAVDRSRVLGVHQAAQDLSKDLLSVEDPDISPIAFELSDHIVSLIIPMLDRSLELGVLLFTRSCLDSSCNKLIYMGLAIQLNSEARLALLAFSLAVTLAGLVPDLSVPMAMISIAHGLADGSGLYNKLGELDSGGGN